MPHTRPPGARRLILVGRTPVPAREKWSGADPTAAEGRAVALLRELEDLGAQTVLAPSTSPTRTR